jgi:hypothetical protein
LELEEDLEDERIGLRTSYKLTWGNGNDVYLWWDRWDPNGVLYERYGFRMVCEAASKSNAKLEIMLKNKDWSWPQLSRQTQSKLALVPIGDVDTPKWIVSMNGMYPCAETWEAIRMKYNEVS